MEAVFQACIQEVREQGRTVLLSSHILAEVEALCDRVSIIRAGRTVESGTLDSLRQLTRTAVTAETDATARGPRPARACTASTSTAHQVRFDVDTVHLAAAIRCLERRRAPHPRQQRRRRSRSCSSATTATSWPPTSATTTSRPRR